MDWCNLIMLQRKSKSFILLLSFAFIFNLLIIISPVQADAKVDILSHSSYIDSLGWLNVVGEVQNTGDQSVEHVKITATFYDSSDVVVDTSFTFADLSTILPGRKSPFNIMLLDESQVSKVDDYVLSVSFSSTVSVQQSLQILSHSSYVDGLGWFNIVGEVENLATGGATHVQVIATCYDSSGTVIDTSFTFTNPSDIESGKKAPFDILILSGPINDIARYELTAESSEFALFLDDDSVNYDLSIVCVGSGNTFPTEGLHTYEEGSMVSVSASASSGWVFSNWLLDSVNVGTENPYALTMDGHHSLVANFIEDMQESPIANFSYSPLNPQVNETITFSPIGCNDPDGTIVSYLWDFGDGDLSTNQNPTHTYLQTGSYTCTLSVTDNDGLIGTISRTIVDVEIPEFPSWFMVPLFLVTTLIALGLRKRLYCEVKT